MGDVDQAGDPHGYRRLRLAPELGAGPVWDDDWDGLREICPLPEDLPISPELAEQLDDWQREYTGLLAFNPQDSAFPSEEARLRWRGRGPELAERLQRELGDGVTVRLELRGCL